MGRLAAGVRGTVTIVAIAAAAIGTSPPLSWWWVAPTLVVLVAWTSVYVLVAWTTGVRPWLASIDLVIGCGLCLALGNLVPVAAQRGTSWVGVVASMMIICAQLAGRPLILLPLGVVVAASFAVGSQLGHRPDDGVNYAITMGIQAVTAATVMRIAIAAGRVASQTFDELQEKEREMELEAVGRADELAHLRTVHNGPLTTLMMAIHGEHDGRPSPLLRRRAAANLDELRRLAADEPVDADPSATARLDERLAQVIVWYESVLPTPPRLPVCIVPGTLVDAFADATSEALENVVRHARTDRAVVELEDDEGTVRVTIADHGRGFDATSRSDHHFGLREAVMGRMVAAGGVAYVQSTPREGTTVVLEWRRG